MENKYEYDGQMIVMRSPTVRSAYASRSIIRKLRDTLVAEDGRLPEELVVPVTEYAEIVARTCAEGAAWWRRETDTSASIREGFEAFMDLDVEFVELAREQAAAAAPEKKMTNNTSKKSSS